MQDDDPERSAHTRWYSNDLDAKLDDWAEKSKHAKADLIERALKDFFDRCRIDSGGHITLKDEKRPQNVSTDDGMLEQVLENQDEILAALNTPHPQDDEERQKINSRSYPSGEASKEADADSVKRDDEPVNNLDFLSNKLIGEWEHDEIINPDDIDSREMKQTPDHYAPVMAGVINYLREEEGVKKMERSKLVEELAHSVGYSKTGVRDNYLPRLEREGSIYPHPSIDDIDVSRSIPERVPIDGDGAMVWDDLPRDKKKRYPDCLDEYVDMIGIKWRDDSYYLSEEAWIGGLRELLFDGWEQMHRRYSSNRETHVRVTKLEAANAYRLALCRVWEVYREEVELSDVDVENVDDVVENAIHNFAAATNVVMKGKDEMEDYRRVVEEILSG